MEQGLPSGKCLVSACLAGLKCRYDGGACPDPLVLSLLAAGRAVPVCPEQLGGLPTPRPPAEIKGGDGEGVLDGRARVVDREGRDVTDAFLRGARETLHLARAANASWCLFKERSPSCGQSAVFNGAFEGVTRPGRGVTTALLEKNGIRVIGTG